MKIYFLIYLNLFFSFCIAKENKLFWDGHDWNRVSILNNNDQKITFRIKSAYLDGILDGRLNYYLKVWVKDQYLADDVFGETVDYLSKRELIKNIDYFYKDRLNIYIPIPSAIVISNMYAERVPVNVIEKYIDQTRRWINDLTLDMDTLNYSKLIEDKILKHQNKSFNQFE